MSSEARDAVKHLIAVKRCHAIALVYRDVLSMRGLARQVACFLRHYRSYRDILLPKVWVVDNFLDNQDFELLSGSIFFSFIFLTLYFSLSSEI